MQDPTLYAQIKPQFPEQEHLKCPRCDSTNTKFCYYNNYNLSQPRHFCKNCKRYWTKGGALRNIPVGGGSRKNTKRSSSNNKRSSSGSPTVSSLSPSTAAAAASSSSSSSSSPSTTQTLPKQEPYGLAVPAPFDQDRRMLDVSGSFSSLLASQGAHFGNLLENLNPNGSNLHISGLIGSGPSQDSGRIVPGQNGTQNDDSHVSLQNGSNSEGLLSVPNDGDSSCWNSSNGWPDLAIFAPGSNFL